MSLFENRYTYADLGLLLMRLGLGIMFTIHGYPKLMGGPTAWTGVGEAMQHLGIHVAPTVWGFLAAVAESLGGQMLLLGLFFRVACVLLLATMIVATVMHIGQGDGFNQYAHALESAFVFLGLLFIGPGRFSIDQSLFPPRRRLY